MTASSSQQTTVTLPEADDYLRDTLSILQDRQLRGAVTFDADCGFSVAARNGVLESVEHYESSQIRITLYDAGRSVSVSTTDCSHQGLEDIVDRAAIMVSDVEVDSAQDLPDSEEFSDTLASVDLYHSHPSTPEEMIGLVESIDQHALDLDKRIVQSDGTELNTSDRIVGYGNTLGVIQSYRASVHSLVVSLIAEDVQGMQSAYDYTVSTQFDHLSDGRELACSVVSDALRRLSPRRIKTCMCPVLFDARVARSLLGHVISALNGRQIDQKRSFLCDAMGDQILPERFSLVQQPHLPGRLGSAPFDAEGVVTRPCCYVESGCVSEWVLNSYTARRLNRKTTGNAGGVYNVEMPHDEWDQPALLKKMDRGLWVTDCMGQGVDLQTGTYSRGVFGFWVEGGEIQYPVHNVTVASSLQKMLLGLVAVGSDVDRSGSLCTGSWLIDEMTIGGES